MNTHKSFEKQNFDEIPLVSVIVPVYNQEQYIEKNDRKHYFARKVFSYRNNYWR